MNYDFLGDTHCHWKMKSRIFSSETGGCELGINKKKCQGTYISFYIFELYASKMCFKNISVHHKNDTWIVICHIPVKMPISELFIILFEYYLTPFCFLTSSASSFCILTSSSFLNPPVPDIFHCTTLARVALISENSV